MSFKCNSNVKPGTVPTCFSLAGVLHSETQRNGALLGPCHSCGAQPHGQADVERSLTASPSRAPDLVGVQVGFPARCLHICQQCCAGLLLGCGSRRCLERRGGGSELPSCSERHPQPCVVPLLCCAPGAPGEAAAQSGVSGSEAFFGVQWLQK